MALTEGHPGAALAEAVAAAVPESEASAYAVAGRPGTRDVEAIEIAACALVDVLGFLRDDPAQRFDMLGDVTAVDRTAERAALEIVYVLRSFASGRRAIVKAVVPAAEPVIATATGLYRSAGWAEREVYDMFGVRFEGHPDLRRILMYEEFEGYPLLKSYPFDLRQPLVPERDPIKDPWPGRG